MPSLYFGIGCDCIASIRAAAWEDPNIALTDLEANSALAFCRLNLSILLGVFRSLNGRFLSRIKSGIGWLITCDISQAALMIV